jgi:hypothetical protein
LFLLSPLFAHDLTTASFRAYSGDVKTRFLMIVLTGSMWAQVPVAHLPRFEDYPVEEL